MNHYSKLAQLHRELADTYEQLAYAPEAAQSEPRQVKFLKIRAFADHVGLGVSTIRRYIDSGMPVQRIGRNVRIDPSVAMPWLEERRAS